MLCLVVMHNCCPHCLYARLSQTFVSVSLTYCPGVLRLNKSNLVMNQKWKCNKKCCSVLWWGWQSVPEVEDRVGPQREEKTTIVSDYIWSRPNTLSWVTLYPRDKNLLCRCSLQRMCEWELNIRRGALAFDYIPHTVKGGSCWDTVGPWETEPGSTWWGTLQIPQALPKEGGATVLHLHIWWGPWPMMCVSKG